MTDKYLEVFESLTEEQACERTFVDAHPAALCLTTDSRRVIFGGKRYNSARAIRMCDIDALAEGCNLAAIKRNCDTYRVEDVEGNFCSTLIQFMSGNKAIQVLVAYQEDGAVYEIRTCPVDADMMGTQFGPWSLVNREMRDITIDSHLSETSANTVQNAAVTNEIKRFENTMTSRADEYEERLNERAEMFENTMIERADEFEAGVEAEENTRVANEEGRIANEVQRTKNESFRVSHEANRVDAEAVRVSAENARNTEESTRIANEGQRTTAEAVREYNETKRKEAESARSTAEVQRANNESVRSGNEENRIAEENVRVRAEQSRKDAEAAREAASEESVGNANRAAGNAADAADAANSAATNANTTASKVREEYDGWIAEKSAEVAGAMDMIAQLGEAGQAQIVSCEAAATAANDAADYAKTVGDKASVLNEKVDTLGQKVEEIDKSVIKSVNGKKPDSNGNVIVEGGEQIDQEKIKSAVNDYLDEHPVNPKPEGGWEKSDLSNDVQKSLSKADTALQAEQYTGTYSKPSGGIPKTDLANSVQTSLEKADTALQPSSISDMETKAHASQTYQPIGSYATTAGLKAVSDKLDEIYDDYLEANSLI